MSVKIWVYHIGSGGGDGMVRLKLRPGAAPLHVWSGGPDDEGWSSRGERWWVEDGVIHNDVATDGRDCDGRMSTHEEYHCPVELRHASFNEYTGYLMPAWERGKSGQRDYSAEAMGY